MAAWNVSVSENGLFINSVPLELAQNLTHFGPLLCDRAVWQQRWPRLFSGPTDTWVLQHAWAVKDSSISWWWLEEWAQDDSPTVRFWQLLRATDMPPLCEPVVLSSLILTWALWGGSSHLLLELRKPRSSNLPRWPCSGPGLKASSGGLDPEPLSRLECYFLFCVFFWRLEALRIKPLCPSLSTRGW